MKLEDKITLISESFETDELEQERSVYSRKEIFAEFKSISQSEFFKASQNGFRPELKITVWSVEYSGESLAFYNGVMYEIYRTYIDGDKTELYLSKKVGAE